MNTFSNRAQSILVLMENCLSIFVEDSHYPKGVRIQPTPVSASALEQLREQLSNQNL